MQSRKIAKGNSRVFGAGIHMDILWGQGSVREGLGACDLEERLSLHAWESQALLKTRLMEKKGPRC